MPKVLPENLNIFDELSLFRMDCLKSLGRKILPSGHWEHDPSSSTVYLTFDDGPSPATTSKLIDLLASEGASATFFLIGEQAQKYPDLVRKIAAHGHAIGSHSLSHKLMPFLSGNEILSEINNANAILAELLGSIPRLFRPPYGLLDKRAADCLTDLGMKIVYWGAVPEDWLQIGSNRVVHKVLRKLTDGTIIVLHEQSRIADQTLSATAQIIRAGKERGYKFKALETLC